MCGVDVVCMLGVGDSGCVCTEILVGIRTAAKKITYRMMRARVLKHDK